jgi:hypothetical protein
MSSPIRLLRAVVGARNVRSYAHRVFESVCLSTAHSRILCGLGLHFFRLSDPQDVVAPYQDLTESALVFGLAPL